MESYVHSDIYALCKMSHSCGPIHSEDLISPSPLATIASSSSSFPFTHKVLEWDAVFRSTDAVLFHVSSSVLTRASRDRLRSILGGKPLDDGTFRNQVIAIPEHSGVLNIVLHTFYELPMAEDLSSMEGFSTAVDRLLTYGLSPQDYIQPNKPLFSALLALAQAHAIQVYTLAAHHELHELAVRVSAYLLSYHPPDMSDDTAVRMGGRYVCRLLKLHISLVSALRRILLAPPVAHGASTICDPVRQQELRRAWVLAASYLVWEANPATSIDEIKQAFLPLGDHLGCQSCKEALMTRVQGALTQWAKQKVHIKLIDEATSRINKRNATHYQRSI